MVLSYAQEQEQEHGAYYRRWATCAVFSFIRTRKLNRLKDKARKHTVLLEEHTLLHGDYTKLMAENRKLEQTIAKLSKKKGEVD